MYSPEIAPWPRTVQSGFALRGSSIHSLFKQYVIQALQGCGNRDCINTVCYSGRCNTSASPVRKPTPRSARALALSLLFSERPERYLCIDGDTLTTIDVEYDEDFPKDNHSLLQHIADADIIKTLADNEAKIDLNISDEAAQSLKLATQHLAALKRVQTAPFTREGKHNAHFVDDVDALDIIVASIGLVINREALKSLNRATDVTISQQLDPLESFLDDHATQKPWRPLPTTPFDDTIRLCDQIDEFRYHPYTALVQAIFKTIAQRTLIVDIMQRVKPRGQEEPSFLQELINKLADAHGQPSQQSYGWRLLGIWSLITWTMAWNGEPVLRRGTVACGILELARSLEQSTDSTSPVAFSFNHHELDMEDLIQSYIKHEYISRTESFHILNFTILLHEGTSIPLFRGLSFLIMRQAQVKAMVALAFYRESLNPHRPPPAAVLELPNRLSATFLVLKTRRDHALEDAFDQLWRRDRSDLSKPLRVLFEELDGVAMGQDFGGVQVEFFNVLFRQVLQEETGLFTTSTASGLSYFRPGSLQPLHMFECVGMLLGLALFNGIAVPVSFPLALYRHLLGQKCIDCSDISDHWPVESRSLTRLLVDNVDEMSLDYSFTFEANGLMVTMSRPHSTEGVDRNMPGIYALSAEATIEHKQPSTPEDATTTVPTETLEWPGMTINLGSSADIMTVTEGNKAVYVQDYIQCLTYLSVKAQVDAFKRGFQQVITPYHIAFLAHGAFKKILEGTTTIDIQDLRKHTVYDGYDDDDEYIEHFWKLLTIWPEERQKALMRFVTAVERFPATGLSSFTFKIQRVSTESEVPRLPTSSTCFGTLFLPQYDSVATLEKMLNTAVELGEYGFGIS